MVVVLIAPSVLATQATAPVRATLEPNRTDAVPWSSAEPQPNPAPSATSRSPALTLSAVSAGSVVETAYVNYNATTPGNFPSAVWDWAAGSAAVDPLTDQLWIPEWPITVDGIPAPVSAPALVYNPATNQTRVVQNLTNTSAFAFDPKNGYLYATDPISNAVLVFNPASETMARAPIRVGIDPSAIVFDGPSGNLYVANSLSSNLTVINGTNDAIVVPGGVVVGNDPVALADDTIDRQMFVALSSAPPVVKNVSTRTNDPGQIAIHLPATASVLAYSASHDLLGVAMPTLSDLGIYNASTFATLHFPNEGLGLTSIVVNHNDSDFVIADGTGSDLVVVNALTGVNVTNHLSVGADPAHLTVDPIDGLIYSWSGAFRIVSTANLVSETEAKQSPDLGARALTLAYDEGSGHVFVVDRLSSSLAVLNANTLTTARSPIAIPGAPESVADDNATGAVYVGYYGGVLGINASTGAIVSRNDALTGNNSQITVDQASGLLWDVNKLTGLEALSIPGLAVAHVVGIGVGTVGIRGVVLDNQTNELFVVDPLNSTVAAVNGTNGQEILPWIPPIVGVDSVSYDAGDQMVYALGQSVWMVDPVSHRIVGAPIAISPHVVAWSIVYDPSREFLYVVSNESPAWPGTLSVIDGSSIAASESAYVTMPLGQLPADLQPIELPGSAAPGSGEIWVTNFVSGTVSIVASPPQVTFLAASPNPVDVAAPSHILLGIVGGAGPSQVTYSGLPSSCVSLDALSLSCTPPRQGSYTINVTVTDTLGITTSAQTVLSVSPPFTINLALDGGTSTEVDLGSSMNGSATAMGGTAPYNFTWAFGDSNSETGGRVSHSYSTVGTYLVTVTATDSGGGISSGTGMVTVEPLPISTASASPSNDTDVNLPIDFAADVTGGAYPMNASWTFGDGFSANGTSVTHAYSSSGIFFANFHYRDSSGRTANSVVMVTVNAALSATTIIAATSAGSSPTAGSAIQFTTEIAGGTEPYTVVWGFDDGSYAQGISTQHTYGAAGTYTVSLSIEDAVGAHWNTTQTLVVTSSSSSSGFGTNFDEGLLLGLVVGAAIAAVAILAATRRKKPTPSSPPRSAPTTGSAPAGTPPESPDGTPEWIE
jgi:DNA-binding beta-propeller fold protein YncE/PKD repeat protein